MITPLDGSKIQVEHESGYQKLVLPQPSGGIVRYFVSAFLLCWLGGWAFGWIAVALQLLKGTGNGSADVFLIFWLGMWTVGGIFAILVLYKSLRPSVPETLVLSKPYLVYDSGIAPFKFAFGHRSQMDMLKKLFQRRIKTQFDQSQLKTLKLREFEGGNRLTIDQGSKRLEIGTGASEPEREWLHELLQKEYNV